MKLYGLVLLLCLNSWGFGKCHGHAHHYNVIISYCDIPQGYVSTGHHTFAIIFIGASLMFEFLGLALCLNSWGFGKCHGHAHHCNVIISYCDIP